MASRDKVRPTPPPRGPALVRPAVGVLVLALGGAAEIGCAKKHPPPMPPPPMPDPGYGEPPMAEPMPPPEDEIAPMPPPQDAPMPVPPMPNPG
jgi:hypothetical protein